MEQQLLAATLGTIVVTVSLFLAYGIVKLLLHILGGE
jgi:hypothetical protein